MSTCMAGLLKFFFSLCIMHIYVLKALAAFWFCLSLFEVMYASQVSQSFVLFLELGEERCGVY